MSQILPSVLLFLNMVVLRRIKRLASLKPCGSYQGKPFIAINNEKRQNKRNLERVGERERERELKGKNEK